MKEERVGELSRRPRVRAAAGPWLVRPGRVAAANDNAPAGRAARNLALRRRLVQVLLLSLLALALLAVGGCGRRGSPELPASAANEARVRQFPDDPGSAKVPNRPFFGDKILQ